MTSSTTVGARQLGRGGLSVPPLALGGAPLGNLFTSVSDGAAADAVTTALSLGVGLVDTAPHYGLGLSEERIGAALAAWDGPVPVLSTKVGRVLDPLDAPRADDEGFAVCRPLRRRFDFSRDGVLRSVEGSLRRLGRDHVDLLLLHDPDDHLSAAVQEAYPVLDELRAQGVVRSVGAGMNQSAALTHLVRETDVDVVMLAGRYTLLEQGALDDLLPACVEREVSVVVAGPFNSGLLSRPVPDARATYDYRPADAGTVARARHLADVCARHGVPLPAAALAFPLGHPAVTAVCVGMRSGDEVRQNVDLAALDVPSALWEELTAEGLLDVRAPLP